MTYSWPKCCDSLVMKYILLLLVSTSSFAEVLNIDFHLEDLDPQVKTRKALQTKLNDCNDVNPTPIEIVSLTDIIKDDKFLNQQKYKDGVFVKITRKKAPDYSEVIPPMGMTNEQALLMSRDLENVSVFSEGHDQGDMANRFSHSLLSRIPGEVLKQMGMSEIAASVIGAVFFVPKEYLYDLHPSAGDLVVTYTDKMGTRSSEFQITVFGDALYTHRPFQDAKPFKESSPFVTWRRKF